jgi:hypothetical protein
MRCDDRKRERQEKIAKIELAIARLQDELEILKEDE